MRLAILVVAVCCAGGMAWASPLVGPGLPGKGEARWGLQHHSLERRALEGVNGNVRSRQEYLTLSYGLTERLSLDLKWMVDSAFRHAPAGHDVLAYKDSRWGGGYGVRYRICQSGPLTVVTGFQHFSNHYAPVEAPAGKTQGILEDWQGSLLFGWKVAGVEPYLGVRYTTLDYIQTVEEGRARIRTAPGRRFSPVLGADLRLTPRLRLNLEADPQDGGSWTAGLTVRG